MNTFMNILTFIVAVVVPIVIPIVAFPLFCYSLLYVIDRKEIKDNKIITVFLAAGTLYMLYISYVFSILVLKSKSLLITYAIIYAVTFLIQFFIAKKKAKKDDKLRINKINSDKEIKEWFLNIKKSIKHKFSKSTK